ncbi:hypothetical protein [Cellulomonas marina]|nr:hypothetical protein [Cellulomonas marina]
MIGTTGVAIAALATVEHGPRVVKDRCDDAHVVTTVAGRSG